MILLSMQPISDRSVSISQRTLFICLSQAVITLPSMKQEECNTISHYLSLWSIKTVCRFPDELFAPWAGSNFFLA